MSQNRRKRQKLRSIFGEQLEKIAHERQLSHRKLAEMAGVSTSVIGSWMGIGGAAPSDLTKVKRLADALCVDFGWLILGEHTNQVSISDVFKETADPNLSGYYRVEVKKLVLRKE